MNGKFEGMFFNDLVVSIPSPEDIKDLRTSLGLSAAQCAKLINATDGSLWRKYEAGTVKPNKQTWTLFLLASGSHPIFKIENR